MTRTQTITAIAEKLASLGDDELLSVAEHVGGQNLDLIRRRYRRSRRFTGGSGIRTDKARPRQMRAENEPGPAPLPAAASVAHRALLEDPAVAIRVVERGKIDGAA